MLRSGLLGRRRLLTVFSSVGLMVILAVAVIGPPMAVAQATRTWVSGVGDDVNPCSRTAPCKTFAGAISKTAAGGEINCLDSGGFGAVTIIKSMTIDCSEVEGGALAGGNGIVVNMPLSTDVTFLRGLDIFGVNPPTNGIRFINNGTLHVDNVRIKRFNAANSSGISVAPTGAVELFVSDSLITDNGAVGSGGGITISPATGGSATVTLDNVTIQNNNHHGFRAETPGTTGAIKVSIFNSRASGHPNHGFAAVAGTGPIEMMISNSEASYNSASGVVCSGATCLTRIGGMTITGNNTGTNPTAGGTIQSYQTNMIDGNVNDGARTNIAME